MSVMELQFKYFPIRSKGGSMGTELRNILRASMLYPPSNDEKIERSPGASGQKLQAPRQLYSSASLQHPPKWPIECQVVPEKVSHFNIVPSIPEPFYVSTNSEPQPRPVGEEMGTVIYDYQPKLCVDYYCRSSYGGSDELTSYDFDDTTLKFESRFEAGNLAKVIKVTNVYYELYLRPDMYTDRHAQWYYFRIRNTRENIVYRFSIVNLSKPDSLYRLGMKPLLYSEKDAQINGIGWIRCGYNISYYKNDITANDNTSSFTLTFNLKFQYSNDTVYIAQCYPYTYSNLQLYLQEIQADRNRAQLCQQRLLCKSLAGNNVYVLTITAPEGQDEEQVKKPAIVLTARVHPGETPSSYMMKGVIDFLTSDSPHAEKLRNRFIFKLIPMLNPDGVIVGNSRCCLLGQDLNRQYRTVLREAFPQIYQKKVLLRRLVDENGIFLYCDIHGHSRRNNVFMYGCENRRIAEKKLTEQVFPLMMHKNAADKFSFSSCKFRIQKSKEGTGRIFVWTLGVTNSYTLEISLCGSTLVSREHTHFNFVDYEDIGRHFCETLLDYSDTATIKEKIRQKILNKLKIGGSTAEEPINIPISDYSSLSHSDSDNESDTTEDDDEQDIVKAKNSVARQASLRNLRNQQAKSKLERKSSGVATKTTEVGSNEKRSRSLGKAAITRGERNTSKYVSIRQTSAKGRQIGTGPAMGAGSLLNSIVTAPKYTNLIFEDPFRPPGIVIMNTSPEETVDTGTQTEDECDCKDAKLRNDIYLKCPSRTTMNALTRSFVSMNLLPRPNRCKLRSRSSSDASSQLETSSKGSSTKLSRLKLLDSSSPASERRRDSLPTPTHSLAAKTGTYKIQNSASQDELVQQKSHLNQHEPLASLKHTSFIRQSAMINLIKREPKHHQPISSRRVSWGGQANFSVTTRRNSVQLETSVRKKSKTGLTRERKALLTDTSASGIGVLLQPTKTEQQWRRSKASKFRN